MRLALGAAAVAVALLAGCTGEAVETGSGALAVPSNQADQPPPTPGASPPAPPPETSERVAPGGSPVPSSPAPPPLALAAPCDDAIAGEVETLVNRQLAAFRERDFAAALALTTDNFRAGFSLAQFERLITDGFPLVLHAESVRVRQCVGDRRQAALLVELRGGAGGQSLIYELLRRDGQWQINGASPHPARSLPTV